MASEAGVVTALIRDRELEELEVDRARGRRPCRLLLRLTRHRSFRRVGAVAALTSFLLAAGGAAAVPDRSAADAAHARADQPTLAFTRDGNLAFMNEDGSDRRVTRSTAHGFPVWSPDGSRIAFDGGSRLWVMRLNRRPRSLTRKPHAYDCTWLDWSPNGRRIAYTLHTDCEGHYAIYAVNADGKRRRRLRPPDTCCAVWSPNGRRILFVKSGRLFVMRPDGRNARAIPHARVDVFNAIPMRPPAVWSRDGKRVYYRGWIGRRDHPTLLVTDVTGRNMRDLTPGLQVFSFALSRDGRRIATSASEALQPRDVYVLDADGTGLQNLSSGGGAVKSDDPQWSPDARKIAFVRWSGPGISGSGQIWVMNADGSDQTNISKNTADESAPTWRPRSS